MMISIIVPVYNSSNTIEAGLESLKNQNFCCYEIIAVDNGSSDSSKEKIKNFKEVILLEEFKKGPAAARNLGIKNARGDIIAFTDSDCCVSEDWLSKIFETFNNHKEAHAIGGSVLNANPNNLISRASEISDFGLISYSKKNTPRWVRIVPTLNAAYRREVFNELGCFDDDIKYAAGEDALFNWRLVKNRKKIFFNPEIKVMHFHRSTIKSFLRKKYIYGKGYVITRIKDSTMPNAMPFTKRYLLPFFIFAIFFGGLYNDVTSYIKFCNKNIRDIFVFPLIVLGRVAHVTGAFMEIVRNK
ncbi:Glycosyltransferase AglI [uncultured archaeon]|nr:Glycosyltransferase AglI [uncultured archaeon]